MGDSNPLHAKRLQNPLPESSMTNPNIPHQDLTYRIIGAAMQVHRQTPRGLREQH
jgi:hypothetical protein